MKVVVYGDEHADALTAGLDAARLAAPLLRIEAYKRHYYQTNPCCRLLLLLDEQGQILATLGSEDIAISMGGSSLQAAIVSNTFSLRQGAFPLLFMQWMKSAKTGLALPGTAAFEAQFAKQKRWTAVHGLHRYWLNWGFPTWPNDALWKKLTKPLVRLACRVDASTFERRVKETAPPGLQLLEESCFDSAMAQPRGNFGFQLTQDAQHLNWRFDTTLGYARYRVFRIERAGVTCGAVVIAEWPHCLLVSHCIGESADLIAWGILLAISRLNQGQHRYRRVILSSMHTDMVALLRHFGFSPAPQPSPLFMMLPNDVAIAEGPHSNWLVNLEIGDAAAVPGLLTAPP